MEKAKHIFLMIFGYLLYLLTFKLIDMDPSNRFFCWALPYIGYQGFHPTGLRWWQTAARI